MALVYGERGLIDPSEYERAILSALDEDGGFTTGQVADRAFPVAPAPETSKASLSARVRRTLLNLESHGLVRRVDSQKPTCWCRTEIGSRAVRFSDGGGT